MNIVQVSCVCKRPDRTHLWRSSCEAMPRRWLTHCCSWAMELLLWATLSGAVLGTKPLRRTTVSWGGTVRSWWWLCAALVLRTVLLEPQPFGWDLMWADTPPSISLGASVLKEFVLSFLEQAVKGEGVSCPFPLGWGGGWESLSICGVWGSGTLVTMVLLRSVVVPLVSELHEAQSDKTYIKTILPNKD